MLLWTLAAILAWDRGFMSGDGLRFPARSRPSGPGVASFQTPNPRHAPARARAQAQAQAPAESRGAWPAEPLTAREIDVLHLLRGPLLLREIAAELRVSPNTIKSHTRAIYRKLGVSTRRDVTDQGQDAAA
jgi:DNA-binding NarL/FixJ family response regulator